jgi:hypothetical protein
MVGKDYEKICSAAEASNERRRVDAMKIAPRK